ncbi:MAG: amino acid permease [Methanocellales archaeon]|nr:amino acid permease [Methanocellales archaeon]
MVIKRDLKLKREIGLFEATAYGVGMILGAGIYVLIGKAAGMAGNATWLSFLIAAIVASFTGLAYAELSSMLPRSAAEYHYVKESFGSERFAFITGWLIIFVEIVATATVSLGFAGYFKSILNAPIIPTALCLIATLSFVNFYGIGESSKVNIAFTMLETFGLILIISLSLNSLGSVDYFEMPVGFTGVMGAAALIFFAYLGFEDVANLAEEAKKPSKTIPKALMISVAITTILYILVAISVVSLADWSELGRSDAPLTLATAGIMNPLIMSFIALFATANTVLILLIVTSRMMYGMGVDRSLPPILAMVHAKRRTPWVAILAVMVLSMCFVSIGDIKLVASITDVGSLVIFALVNFSLILLRYKRPEWKRPFKVPLNIDNQSIIPFCGLFSCMFMLLYFDPRAILLGIFMLIFGILFYQAKWWICK